MSDALFFPKDPSAKQRKKSAKHAEEKAFRGRVWVRDGGKDRATGQVLYRDHWDPTQKGEVCHLKGRNVMPEWKVSPERALLLSMSNHILSDGRGNYRLKLTDPETGEPATDAGLIVKKPIRFTLHDKDGSILWSRLG